MNSNSIKYPSKDFLLTTKNKIKNNESYEVIVKSKLRIFFIKKEIHLWRTGMEYAYEKLFTVIPWCAFFTPYLMGLHDFAMSSGYQFEYVIEDKRLVLRYKPVSKNS
jgi:hypothetical protein